MQSLKDKFYNYEVEPPVDNWQAIVKTLDQDQPVAEISKRSKVFYFSLNIAAATVGLIFFSLIFLLTGPGKTNKDVAGISFEKDQKFSNSNDENDQNKYITICGPQGQPVKISAKVAKLIVSSDSQNPPTPVWNAKVNKWKDLMSTNVLVPTTANFFDIVELTQALK